MKSKIVFFLLILALFCGIWFVVSYLGAGTSSGLIDGEKSSEYVAIPEHELYTVQEYVVQEDDTFADVVSQFGITYEQMLRILSSAVDTYDFTRIRSGRPFYFTFNKQNELVHFDYEPNAEEVVHVVITEDDVYEVTRSQIEYEIELVTQTGIVSSSLYVDGLKLEIPEPILIQYAEVFAWTIDFSVQVQKDDSFTIVYEKRYRNGAEAGYGIIHAAEFVNRGKSYYAYKFHDADGDVAYYNEAGESTVKQFLRAPLEYRRITSGYTYGRFHPVLQQAYDHLAIDYAAPIGTPVMAVGDGVVMSAGWNGGFGHYIDIRHNETFSTQYAHLSKYATGIKRGAVVTQGQVIGYVGSTGWSTGPHLHYQIKQHDKLVNPLTIDLPPGDPVSDELREEFSQKVIDLNIYLD